MGPGSLLGHSSVVFMSECSVDYTLDAIRYRFVILDQDVHCSIVTAATFLYNKKSTNLCLTIKMVIKWSFFSKIHDREKG